MIEQQKNQVDGFDFERFIMMRITELKNHLENAKYERTRESIIDSIRHNEWILMQITGIISSKRH